MRFWLSLTAVILVVWSCNDGEVIEVQLDFDKNLDLCEIQTSSLGSTPTASFLFYDIRPEPFESLTLLIPKNTSTEALFNPENSGDTQTLSINGSSVQFHYRSYNADPNPLMCAVIPPVGVNVTQNYESNSGSVTFTSTFEDDDNDGVPTALEFDGDSDGDGIPNYKDNDDDGDNVPTKNEKPDLNNDGDISDAQDSDADGIPDYLDSDDDGDGTLTIHEDANGNGNLFDDIATGSSYARFLDENFSDSYNIQTVNENQFERIVNVAVKLYNIDISILSADFFDLGSYETRIQF